MVCDDIAVGIVCEDFDEPFSAEFRSSISKGHAISASRPGTKDRFIPLPSGLTTQATDPGFIILPVAPTIRDLPTQQKHTT